MSQRPLLVFPSPTSISRQKPGGGGSDLTRPSLAEQRQRLAGQFAAIVQSFRALQSAPTGLPIEQVIVLETIGASIDGLAEAARKIPGLEWVAELDLDDVKPQAGFALAEEPEKALTCRLYAFVSNQAAIEQLLGLWNDWANHPDKRAKSGFRPLKDLFKHLRVLRRWSAEDRLHGTYFVEDLQAQLNEGYGELRFEVELICRDNPEARTRASQSVRELARADGAETLADYALPEIGYHGMLFRMPADHARQTLQAILAQQYTRLIQCEHVFFFRPFGQSRTPAAGPAGPEMNIPTKVTERSATTGSPVLGILDGLPLEQHQALRNRLLIDDPDDLASQYQSPTHQCHGTAMAGAVIHGDLNQSTESHAQPVYVRPIFVPKMGLDGQLAYEGTPDNRLLVDLIHSAVRRMFEATGGDPVAPTVKVINLALGNPKQPFDRETSPLARLLDWLAWKFRVLFIVSSGNQMHDLVLTKDQAALASASPEELAMDGVQSMIDGRALRRLLSPAESVNALTVGPVHADAAGEIGDDPRFDIHGHARLPSPLASIGAGFRRSVKPEILLPGGRVLFRINPAYDGQGTCLIHTDGIGPPGIKVASPGVRPGELTRAHWTRGSSNSAALASHLAGLIHEHLEEFRAESDDDHWRQADMAVLIKCLLVHGASWGNTGEFLETAFRPRLAAIFPATKEGKKQVTEELRQLKANLLGYGEVDPTRCLFCTDERVTLFGWSHIGHDEGQQFELPLPAALSAQLVRRSLTVTLAWMSPVNPKHRLLRRAQLWFDVLGDTTLASKTSEMDAKGARRGTVEHRIFTGTKAIPVGDDQSIFLRVNCKEEAGALTDRVPYAIAATLEVARPLEVSIYQQIAERIRPRIDITPRP